MMYTNSNYPYQRVAGDDGRGVGFAVGATLGAGMFFGGKMGTAYLDQRFRSKTIDQQKSIINEYRNARLEAREVRKSANSIVRNYVEKTGNYSDGMKEAVRSNWESYEEKHLAAKAQARAAMDPLTKNAAGAVNKALFRGGKRQMMTGAVSMLGMGALGALLDNPNR